MQVHKYYYLDFFLLLFLVVLSGVPYFVNETLYIILFTVLGFQFFYRKLKFDFYFLKFISVIIILLIIQSFKFNFFPFITNIGLLIKLFSAYFIVKLLKERFVIFYIRILYYISILSLIIYFFILFIPQINSFLIEYIAPIFRTLNPSDNSTFILIYTYSTAGEYRNTGPFWEPGAFGGYLMIALIFNYLYYDKLFNKWGIVLLITVITTFSTTAIIGLFAFLFFIFVEKTKYFILKIFVFFILILISIKIFNELEFVGKKIINQLEMAQVNDPYLDSEDTQRFLNILRDMEDLKGHEIVGRGLNPLTRYLYDPFNQIRTVGITDVLVKFGIPFFIWMFYLIFISIKKIAKFYNKNNFISLGFFVVYIIMLMSEVYFNYPFYWCFLFFHLIVINKDFRNNHILNPIITK